MQTYEKQEEELSNKIYDLHAKIREDHMTFVGVYEPGKGFGELALQHDENKPKN
jgi:hypothetical protein